jgi:hypothetical protein
MPWTWDQWDACLALVSDATAGTPTPIWGTWYKSHLASIAGGGVDTIPPDTSITTKPAVTTTTTTADFSFTSTEVGSSYICQLDSNAAVSCNSGSIHLTSLGIGQHTFKVKATDISNNVDATPATYTWTIRLGSNSTNLALGKQPTTNGSASPASLALITDGDRDTNNTAGISPGAVWIKIDLGQSYNLNDIKVWHFYQDLRTYHDVIVQVSNDANFATGVTTVFNDDTDNSAGQGIGTDSEYVEDAAGGGKDVYFNPVNARYIRLWTNGSTSNTVNHYVEVEAYEAASGPVSKTGDLNSDDLINIFDLSILLSNYNKTQAQSSNAKTDLNNDGNINIFDLSILLSNYGK